MTKNVRFMLCMVPIFIGPIASAGTGSQDLIQCASGPCSDWHMSGQSANIVAGESDSSFKRGLFLGLGKESASSQKRSVSPVEHISQSNEPIEDTLMRRGMLLGAVVGGVTGAVLGAISGVGFWGTVGAVLGGAAAFAGLGLVALAVTGAILEVAYGFLEPLFKSRVGCNCY